MNQKYLKKNMFSRAREERRTCCVLCSIHTNKLFFTANGFFTQGQ